MVGERLVGTRFGGNESGLQGKSHFTPQTCWIDVLKTNHTGTGRVRYNRKFIGDFMDLIKRMGQDGLG